MKPAPVVKLYTKKTGAKVPEPLRRFTECLRLFAGKSAVYDLDDFLTRVPIAKRLVLLRPYRLHAEFRRNILPVGRREHVALANHGFRPYGAIKYRNAGYPRKKRLPLYAARICYHRCAPSQRHRSRYPAGTVTTHSVTGVSRQSHGRFPVAAGAQGIASGRAIFPWQGGFRSGFGRCGCSPPGGR